jgi:hypothetical protein
VRTVAVQQMRAAPVGGSYNSYRVPLREAACARRRRLFMNRFGDHIQAIDAMLEDRQDDLDEETLSQKLDKMFNNYEMAVPRETNMLRAAWPNRSKRCR